MQEHFSPTSPDIQRLKRRGSKALPSQDKHGKLLQPQRNCFPPRLFLFLSLHLRLVSVCPCDMGRVGLPRSFDVPKGGAQLHHRVETMWRNSKALCYSVLQSLRVWTEVFSLSPAACADFCLHFRVFTSTSVQHYRQLHMLIYLLE